MRIDWLTVAAQILNFVVLVYLLKRFLYRPVLDAMARREHRIAQELRDAEQREKKADERAQEFWEKSEQLAYQRTELLQTAREEANEELRRRLDEGRTALEEQRQRWQTELEHEWKDVRTALRRRIAGSVTEVTRRVLSDLADAELERVIGRVLCRRLSELGPSDLEILARSDEAIEVATAFEPSDEFRRDMGAAVRQLLGREVRFGRRDGLVGGVELRAEGWKLSWTVEEYLRGLEERFEEIATPEITSVASRS